MPAYYIRNFVIPEFKTLIDLARERLLAGFRDIDAEAQAKTDEAWSDWMSQPGDEDSDPSDGAEWANDIGVEHYIALTNLHQATRNLLAVQMFHLFEQQVEEYKRKCGQWRQMPVDWKDAANRGSLPSASIVDELRLVANTAKHAEGGSAESLKSQRPDLFVNPVIARLSPEVASQILHEVRAPFAGDGLFVQDADLERYQEAVISIWEEMAAIHSGGHR